MCVTTLHIVPLWHNIENQASPEAKPVASSATQVRPHMPSSATTGHLSSKTYVLTGVTLIAILIAIRLRQRRSLIWPQQTNPADACFSECRIPCVLLDREEELRDCGRITAAIGCHKPVTNQASQNVSATFNRNRIL